ncbi:MAG: hypothetical protein D6769_03020, partial [Methanobacteriota archaeon]
MLSSRAAFLTLTLLFLLMSILHAASVCPYEYKASIYSTITLNQNGDMLSVKLTAFQNAEFRDVQYPTFLFLISGTSGCSESKPCLYKGLADPSGYFVFNITQAGDVIGENLSKATFSVIYPYYNASNSCKLGEALALTEPSSPSQWTSSFSNIPSVDVNNALSSIPCIPTSSIDSGSCPSLSSWRIAQVIDPQQGPIDTSVLVPAPSIYTTSPPTPPASSLSFTSTSSDFFWPFFLCTSIFGILLAAAFASGQNPFFWFTLQATRRSTYRSAGMTSFRHFQRAGYAYGKKGLWVAQQSAGTTLGALKTAFAWLAATGKLQEWLGGETKDKDNDTQTEETSSTNGDKKKTKETKQGAKSGFATK